MHKTVKLLVLGFSVVISDSVFASQARQATQGAVYSQSSSSVISQSSSSASAVSTSSLCSQSCSHVSVNSSGGTVSSSSASELASGFAPSEPVFAAMQRTGMGRPFLNDVDDETDGDAVGEMSKDEKSDFTKRTKNMREMFEQRIAANSFEMLAHEILTMGPRRVVIQGYDSHAKTVATALDQDVIVECEPKKLIKDFLGGGVIREYEEEARGKIQDASQRTSRQIHPNELILISHGNTKFLPAYMPFPCTQLVYQLIRKIRKHVAQEKQTPEFQAYLKQKAAELSVSEDCVPLPRIPLARMIVVDGTIEVEDFRTFAQASTDFERLPFAEIEAGIQAEYDVDRSKPLMLPDNAFMICGHLNGNIDTFIDLDLKKRLLKAQSPQALELILNLYYRDVSAEVINKKTGKPFIDRSEPIKLSVEGEQIFTLLPLTVQHNLLLNYNIVFHKRDFIIAHLSDLVPALMPFASLGTIREEESACTKVSLSRYNRDNFARVSECELHVPIYACHISRDERGNAAKQKKEGSFAHPLSERPFDDLRDTSCVILGYADGIASIQITEDNLARLGRLTLPQLQLIRELAKASVVNVAAPQKVIDEYENAYIFLSLPGDMQNNLYLNYDIKIKKRIKIKNFLRNHTTTAKVLSAVGTVAVIGFKLMKH